MVIEADLCVIGAGSAGLSVAAGAAQMGAGTVLIEAGRMGGDCLNTGCVPSKSMLAAARIAQTFRRAERFGIDGGEPHVDYPEVRGHVQRVIGTIAPHDSVERFSALGCTVLQAPGRFIDGATVEAGERRVRARRFVVATGSHPAVPPIPGLSELPFLTNETVFDNPDLPRHLLVIGAGPIGCEMAQAHRRLGAEVTMIDIGPMLPKDDPEAVSVVRQALIDEGVGLAETAKVLRVEKSPAGLAVILDEDGRERRIEGSHLLAATGRRPNVDGLGLEAAGVRYGPGGIEVDTRLRTSNRRIFAAGDVAGGLQFTHLAAHHAGIVLRNALFRLPARLDVRALPWVTYTDPELAQVGLTESQARGLHGDRIRILRADFAANDRAQAEGSARGFVKAMVTGRGQVLGATIVGPHAGELIQPWGLAVAGRLSIGSLAGMIAPYPTLGEINKRVAGSFYTPTLFGRRTRALVRLLGLLG
jgi:pyruvate/2-oxoglutarate dehydrogenase complex dihydrolipoamide dehydrogenase (E3) component